MWGSRGSMASKEENKTLGRVYQEEFQPDYYIKRYYSGIDAGNEFCLENLHQFFEEGKIAF